MHLFYSLNVIRTPDAGYTSRIVSANHPFDRDRSAAASGLRAGHLSFRWLYLDSRILGLRPGRILLGARYVGNGAGARSPLDPWLLGMGR